MNRGASLSLMNPYHVLGVPSDASLEIIKATYRRLARENHPDNTRNDSERASATQRMSAINAAWQMLSDPQQRATVDARLKLERLEKDARDFRERGIRSVPPTVHTSLAPGASRASRHRTNAAAPISPLRSGSNSTRATRRADSAGTRRQATQRGARQQSAQPAKMSSQSKLLYAERILREQGNLDAATKICLSVLRTDFRNIPARQLLSEIYVAQGQPHRAFALLEQALMLNPTNAVLVKQLNQLAARSGRLNPASKSQHSVRTSGTSARAMIPSASQSARALSVKHSVLGHLWASLFRKSVGGK